MRVVTLEGTLVEVWRRVLVDAVPEIAIDGRTSRVGQTRSAGLRTVTFLWDGRAIDGIEQNPNTRSRWAKMAQAGRRIMQFTTSGRYFANVCDGVVTRYPAWTSLGLPD